MISIQRGLLLLATAGVAVAPLGVRVAGNRVQSDREVNPQTRYTKAQTEYYLTEEQFQWIRPGLQVHVDSVDIPGDRHPVVELSVTDDLGQPLDVEGVLTPGQVSMSFILSWYDAENTDYVAYTTRPQTSPITGDTEIQASSDSGGTLEILGVGSVRYTYGTQLPADYDMTVTHSVGIYATRNLTELLDKNYYANEVYDFRPDGMAVTETWGALSDDTCNACHEQLAFHGGSRREVKLCVLCHNSGTVDPDTGNTVDMKVMIHKIHRGADLPSVQAGTPYQIIGFRQSVHDYSHVVFPQDVRNCTTCHPPDAPEGHIWFTDPGRDACGSCHDDIDWDLGIGHPIPQTDDSQCALCHQPQGDREFDRSIIGAHTIPTKSEQLAGLNVEILDVTGTDPGMTPTITFTVNEDDGTPVDPATLSTARFRIGGPAAEYEEYFTETVSGAVSSGGAWVFTSATPIPETATGTWSFTGDFYRFVTIDDGGEGIEVREAAFNPLFYAAVTDAEPEPRREIVSLDKCNVCHDVLALHGGQRFTIENCVVCHNPAATDEEVRPEEELPPEAIHFKWMIHKIHTGAELGEPYIIYGFRGSVHDYSHVGFPGDRRTCETCHLPGTYGVPVPDEALPTHTSEERDYIAPMPPASAACLSCHNSVDAAAHAYTQTAPFGESCGACHGDNREFSVEQVHAH